MSLFALTPARWLDGPLSASYGTAMGVCIAYRGKLSSPSLIPELIADLRARAKAAGWPYHEMPELVANGRVSCPGLTGLSVYPHPECEPVRFHFDAEGVFVNHVYQAMLTPGSKAARAMAEAMSSMIFATPAAAPKKGSKKGAKGPKKGGESTGPKLVVPTLPPDFGSPSFIDEGRRYNWTKTQFAGPDVHIAVCELLRSVKERYAPDLEILDDSGYYETGDRDKLLGALAYTDRILAATQSAFEAVTTSKRAPKTLDGIIDRVNDELAKERDKMH